MSVISWSDTTQDKQNTRITEHSKRTHKLSLPLGFSLSLSLSRSPSLSLSLDLATDSTKVRSYLSMTNLMDLMVH